MAPCDLIRNYVHEHFEGEAEQRRVYEQRWLPMERGCCAAAGAGVEVAAACERGFAPALQQLCARSARPGAAAAVCPLCAAAARSAPQHLRYTAVQATACPNRRRGCVFKRRRSSVPR